jgi:hypothetical protein
MVNNLDMLHEYKKTGANLVGFGQTVRADEKRWTIF